MRINGSESQLPEVRDAYLRQVSERTEPGKSQSASKNGDSVRISSDGKEALRIMAEVSKAPDVREEKVRELQAKIQAGTYKVSGAQVAESLIKETMLGTII